MLRRCSSSLIPHLLSALFLLTIVPATPAAEPADAFPTIPLWPLVYMVESPQATSTDVLFPLFHYERQNNRTKWRLRPWLISSENDPEHNYSDRWLLLFLFNSERRDDNFRRHLFPVYWHGDWEHERWFYLWPLYGQEQDDNGNDYDSLLPPLFGYRRNDAAGTWSVDWLWPLGNIEQRTDGSSNRFFPFWYQEQTSQGTKGLIFPYFWARDNEGERIDALFPLWYRQIKGEHHFSFFLPVWLQQKDPESETTLLFPFWLSRSSGDQSFTTLFPLHFRWQNADSRFRLTLPVHVSWDSPQRQVESFFPVYFRHRNLNVDSDLFYLFPVYGSYTRSSSYQRNFYLFPLFSNWHDSENGLSGWNLLWPLVHYERTPESFESWLLPLFWAQRSNEEQMSMALGLWWSRQDQISRFRLLAPLYIDYDKEGSGQSHLLPFYSELHRTDGYQKRFFLGPLWINTHDPKHQREQTDILWPLISHEQQGARKHLRILPFYWQDSRPGSDLRIASLALLPPYYFHLHEGEDHERFLFWPFYGLQKEPGYTKRSVIWPLFRWGESDDGRRSSRQLLLAYADHNGEEGFSGFFPLWHRNYTAHSNDIITLLSWSRQHGEAKHQFSLLHLGDPDLSLFTVRGDGSEKHQHLLPLFWHSHKPQAAERDLALIWPLYTYRQRGEATRHRLLWKLLYTESGPDKSESGFLWRLIHAKSDDKEQVFEFNPFYYHESHADGASYTAWLGGLYATLDHTGGRQTTLLWLIRFGVPLPK